MLLVATAVCFSINQSIRFPLTEVAFDKNLKVNYFFPSAAVYLVEKQFNKYILLAFNAFLS